MHMNLFFDHYFNILSAKTKINKNLLNLVNLDGLAFKRQKYDPWIAMCLNHFENGVIWTLFQLFLKLHSHITVLWRFCRISEISEFSFLGIGMKTKTQKSRKIFILQFFFSQTLPNLLLCFSFFIFQLLFPWFPWFPRFPSFRPGQFL